MSQDVTALWNAEAATFNFNTTAGAAVQTTFAESFNGSDFLSSFHEILTAIDKTARPDSTNPPGLGGDDPMLASLENYPDNP